MKGAKVFYGDVFLDEEKLHERNTNYPVELKYYKTRNSRNSLENEKYEIFGIEIVKREYREKGIYTESMCINDLTKNERILDKVIGMLRRNAVTPVTLEYVLADIFNN